MIVREGQRLRAGPAGLHLFDRTTGLNILFDEVITAPSEWARAPRQVSIALTNACDFCCPNCFAPKNGDVLPAEQIKFWLRELDQNGCLGVGFGGGEPTLHPDFPELCRYAVEETNLAV